MDPNWKMSKDDLVKNGIVLLLLISFLILQKIDPSTAAQAVLEGIKEDQFYGKIDSIYHDRWDHNNKKARLTSGYVYSLYPEWELKVAIGDSLAKEKDSVVVTVFKKNGSKELLDYRVLVKNFKE